MRSDYTVPAAPRDWHIGASPACLAPNLNEAGAFLEALASGERVMFQTFDDGEAKRGNLVAVVPASASALPRNLAELNERGAGVFVMVNAGAQRRADAVTRVRALFADFDRPDPGREFSGLPLAPSIIVESSPGKHHAYWLADPAAPWPLAEFAEAQRRIAAALGTDPKVCDLPRVMRLPGYWHRKAQPFMVRVVRNTGHRYRADELRAWLESLPVASVPSAAAGEVPPLTPDGAKGSLVASAGTPDAYACRANERALGAVVAAPEGERNATLNREAFGLYGLHLAGRLPDPTEHLRAAGAAAGLAADETARTLASARAAATPRAATPTGSVAQGRPMAREATSQAGATRAPQALPAELLPVEPFPLAALPDAFRPWVQDVAERMQCPPDFVAVPLIVAAASLVARHVGIRPQARTDWTERGNLWALIVGRPGVMKSPAMSQALAPIDRLEARAADEFNADAKQRKAQAMAAKLLAKAKAGEAFKKLKKDSGADVSDLLADEADGDDKAARRRYVVNDTTYEALGEVLSANPDGVLVVRDEMRGLFLHLAREESAEALAFYLTAWSGGRYTFDRILRGTVTVEDARLSIVGGIQPGPLSELVRQARRGAADVGLIERFLIAWPDVVGQWREVDRWPETEARRSAWGVFDRLDKVTAGALRAEREANSHGEEAGLSFLRFSDDAREAFGEWRGDLERKLRGCEPEGLEAALSKFKHHVPALALALHVIDGGAGPVTLVATLRALALASYFESHARRLHSSGQRVAVRAARAILDKARAGELPDSFTLRDVHRPRWAGLSEHETVADALDLLAAHGWLTEAAMATGGRPTTTYCVTEGARRG